MKVKHKNTIRKHINNKLKSSQRDQEKPDISIEPSKNNENSQLDQDSNVPMNSQNRIGRWTTQEINSLKTAMCIFGD